MRRRTWFILLGTLISVVIVAAVAGVLVANSLREPALYLAPQYLWAKDAHTVQLPVPTTSENPGPTVRIMAQRERGFGPFLTGSDLPDVAVASGHQTLSTITQQMQRLGWKALFAPARTDSFPDYGLYITFQAGPHYCYILYRVTGVDQPQALQSLDIWFN